MTFELTDDELNLAYHAVGIMLQESACSVEDDEEARELERKLRAEVERRKREKERKEWQTG